MRWQMGRRSQNVEDRRGLGMPGGGMRMPGGGGGFRRAGLGGIGLVIVIVLALFFGVDPSQLLQQGGIDTGGYVSDSSSGSTSSAATQHRSTIATTRR